MTNPLRTSFLGKELETPLVLASGVMDISYSGMLRCAEAGAGMITTKSLTYEKRKGHKGPVVAEFPGGFINSMGLCNPGIEEGLKEIDEFKLRSDVPVIVSIFAADAEGFCKLIPYVNSSKADFIELNLSCPNVANEFGVPLASSVSAVKEIVTAVAAESNLPFIAKLSPNTYNVTQIAEMAINCGASAVNLINTLGPGMIIDINARKPVISSKYGGVSGYAVKPIAVKLVYETYHKLKCPIIGTGGAATGEDVIEFLLAGAAVVGVGTAVYYRGVEVFTVMKQEIINYLEKNSFTGINEILPIE